MAARVVHHPCSPPGDAGGQTCLEPPRCVLPSRSMIRCCLLLCCAVVASAAQFNPRVSDTEIPFNGSVRATFSTTRPQVPDVDIARDLRIALELPSVVRDWRLVGEPEVMQHEKARDVSVSLLFKPRRSGELDLPEIPVSWLEGDRTVRFATVTVADHLVVGTEQRELPVELEAVGGYAWGSERDAILATEPGNRVEGETGRETVIATPAGLQLLLLDGRLAEVEMVAGGLRLDAALASFVQRWGSPREQDTERANWILGWLRIDAANVPQGVLLRLRHEGIASRAMRRRVEGEVFRLLETGRPVTPTTAAPDDEPAAAAPDEVGPEADPQTPDEVGPEADPQAPAAAAGDGDQEPEQEAIPIEEIEAELRRRVGE